MTNEVIGKVSFVSGGAKKVDDQQSVKDKDLILFSFSIFTDVTVNYVLNLFGEKNRWGSSVVVSDLGGLFSCGNVI